MGSSNHRDQRKRSPALPVRTRRGFRQQSPNWRQRSQSRSGDDEPGLRPRRGRRYYNLHHDGNAQPTLYNTSNALVRVHLQSLWLAKFTEVWKIKLQMHQILNSIFQETRSELRHVVNSASTYSTSPLTNLDLAYWRPFVQRDLTYLLGKNKSKIDCRFGIILGLNHISKYRELSNAFKFRTLSSILVTDHMGPPKMRRLIQSAAFTGETHPSKGQIFVSEVEGYEITMQVSVAWPIMGDVATCTWKFVCKHGHEGEEICECKESWKIESVNDADGMMERRQTGNREPVLGLEIGTLRVLRRSTTPPSASLITAIDTHEEGEELRGRRTDQPP